MFYMKAMNIKVQKCFMHYKINVMFVVHGTFSDAFICFVLDVFYYA